jgi:hypothetical protein
MCKDKEIVLNVTFDESSVIFLRLLLSREYLDRLFFLLHSMLHEIVICLGVHVVLEKTISLYLLNAQLVLYSNGK